LNIGKIISPAAFSDRNAAKFSERGLGEKMRQRSISLTATLLFITALTVLAMPHAVSAQMDTHHHAMTSTDASDSPEIVQDWAKSRLAQSPRHHEWVKVKNGNREVNSFVVYPETKKKATGGGSHS
jgi:hypothetical protein